MMLALLTGSYCSHWYLKNTVMNPPPPFLTPPPLRQQDRSVVPMGLTEHEREPNSTAYIQRVVPSPLVSAAASPPRARRAAGPLIWTGIAARGPGLLVYSYQRVCLSAPLIQSLRSKADMTGAAP